MKIVIKIILSTAIAQNICAQIYGPSEVVTEGTYRYTHNYGTWAQFEITEGEILENDTKTIYVKWGNAGIGQLSAIMYNSVQFTLDVSIANGTGKNVSYTYDNMGNREHRIIELKSAKVLVNDLPVDEEPLSEEIINAKGISIYPNPTGGMLHIKIDGNYYNANIIVYNVEGKEVVAHRLDNSSTNLDLSHLNNGVYFLTIDIDNEQKEWKIIKK